MRKLLILGLSTLVLFGCGALSDPDFAKTVAMSDMYEVEAGKIAQQKGQSPAVKGFGQMMVDAHSKTTAELKAIVQAKAIKVELPTKLDAKHQSLIDDLNGASNDDFDRTYADQQVTAHEEAVSLFEKFAKEGDNPDLKQFAQKTLPVIQQHLNDAKKLPQ